MRLPCPYCGDRDAQEFSYRGDAGPRRPEGEDGLFDATEMFEAATSAMDDARHEGGARMLVAC